MTRQSDTIPIQSVLEAAATNHRIPLPVLPEELINEILLRLPVKSLLQFKCVCKSWKALISDSQFSKNHLLIPSMTNQQLVFSNMNKMVSYPLKPLFANSSTPVKPDTNSHVKIHKYNIIGSCNGLLCLFHRSQKSVRLWNPSIRFKSKKSPRLVPRNWMIEQYGFGYDHVNDKYKVLLVAVSLHDFTRSIKIYTFGEILCKTIQNGSLTPIMSILWLGLGIFVSGTLNWIIDGVSILSFDMEKETFREVLLPQNDGENVSSQPRLYVLSNWLCVCDIYGTKRHQWDMWLMKEYGVVESWTKLKIINSENQPSFAFVEPLFILDNGGALLLASKFPFQFALYKLNSSGLDYRLITTSTVELKPCTPLHIHRESLVSPQW